MTSLLRILMPVLLLTIVPAFVSAQETSVPEVQEETPAVYNAKSILDTLNIVVQETFSGEVVNLSSGDMITIKRNEVPVTVRLYGVDSPEEGQGFHNESREQLREQVLNKEVTAHIVAVDSLEIPVALVFDAADVCLSHWSADRGISWWDERNAPKDSALRKLNADAVIEQRGLFTDALALAPWDYRSSHELPDFTYTVKSLDEDQQAKEDTAEKEEDGPPLLKASGADSDRPPRIAPPPVAAQAPTAVPPTATAGLPLSVPGVPDDLLKDVNVGDIMMRHQPRIATDASGRPLGLTASNVGAIPYATQYGFREGDIVSRVNGIAIESEAQIFSLIPQFMNVKNFQVEVLRNGQTVTIPISVR